jgi:hypothetical protein
VASAAGTRVELTISGRCLRAVSTSAARSGGSASAVVGQLAATVGEWAGSTQPIAERRLARAIASLLWAWASADLALASRDWAWATSIGSLACAATNFRA